MRITEVSDLVVGGRKLKQYPEIYAEVLNYNKASEILHHATYRTSGNNLAHLIAQTPWLDEDMDFDVKVCSPEIRNWILRRMASASDYARPLIGEAYHLMQEGTRPIVSQIKKRQTWSNMYDMYSKASRFLLRRTGADDLLEYAVGRHPVELHHSGKKTKERGFNDSIYIVP